MIIQLVPPVPLTTSKGDAKAMLYIDRGVDHFGEWVCFILKTGECWTFRDKDIRLWANETEGRETISAFHREITDEDMERFRQKIMKGQKNEAPTKKDGDDDITTWI